MNSDLVGAFLSTQFKMCLRLRSLETSHYGLKNVLKEYSYSHKSAFSPRYLLKNLNFFQNGSILQAQKTSSSCPATFVNDYTI